MRIGGLKRGGRSVALSIILASVAVVLSSAPGNAAAADPPKVTLIAPGFGPMATGDLTGDGLPDLAVVLRDGIVAVWAGPTSGEPAFYLGMAGARDLSLGDLDGDGATDVAVLTDTGVSFFLHSTGYQTRDDVLWDSAVGMLLADLQGDGLSDVVLWDGSRVAAHVNLGGLTFAPPRVVARGADWIAAGDLDGDGDLEVVAATPSDLVVIFNLGAGEVVTQTVHLDGTYTRAKIRAQDLDGDGLPEIALLRCADEGGELSLYWGGPGQVTGGPDIVVTEVFSDELVVEDLDGDGLGDVGAVLGDGGIRIFFLDAGPRGMAVRETGDVPARGTGNLRHMAVADFSSDGLVDLAVRAKGSVYIYPQIDAPASFEKGLPSFNQLPPGEVATVDLSDHFYDDHTPPIFRVVGDTGSGLTIELQGASLSISAPPRWYGRAILAVEAWDGVPGHQWTRSDDLVFFVNAPPRIASLPPTQGRVGDTLTYFVTAYDAFPEDDVVSFALLRGPAGVRLDARSGRLTWDPELGGEYRIALAARDAYGGEDVQTFSVKVKGVPAAPIAGPAGVVAAGLASLVGLLGAWGIANENARFGAGLLVAPLYTKLKREQILQHFVRGQIYGYILANPGEHYNAIREALGLTNGSVAHHLATLEREGFVKSRKFGLYRRFYPMNMRIPEDGEYVNEVRRTLLDVVRKRPGISQVDLAQTMNLTPPTVNYHLGILRKAEKVKVVRKGRRTQCFAV